MKVERRKRNAECQKAIAERRVLAPKGSGVYFGQRRIPRVTSSAEKDSRPCEARRAGLSLLEVMLAIAILGLALATMGELVRLGTQAAAETRDLTKAQILCEGIMSELAAGILPLEPADQTPYELDPEWTYSVIVTPINENGLLNVAVMVQKVVEDSERPADFTLTRWIIDPLLEQVVDAETIQGGDTATDASGAAATSGTQSGGTQGGSQSGGTQNSGGQGF